MEVDQSQLQAKISKSKVELARRHNIVQSLEERQRLEIGRLHNQISALQRHISALEASNEEMRQKLQHLTEQAIYGDGNSFEKFQTEHRIITEHSLTYGGKRSFPPKFIAYIL